MKQYPKTSNKDLNKLIKVAYQQGWIPIKRKRSAHLKLLSPDGKKIVTISFTTKSRRAIKNAKSELENGGVIFE